MKKWNFFFGVCACVILLAACGSNDDTVGNGNSEDSNSNDTSSDEQVTLRVMDWYDSTLEQRDEFHRKFMEKYPHVTIEYTTLTLDQFRDTILSAVRTGEAPDIFPVPFGFRLPNLVEDGWYQPLEGLVDEALFNEFSEGTFVEGITTVDNDIYTIPQNLPAFSTIVFYNKDLFREAGLDPEQPPTTYEEFRDYAKKITEAGNGNYYGIIEGGRQTQRWTTTVQDWSSLNGSGLSEASPVSVYTGEAPFHTEAVLDVFDLFAGIADDGSYHPQTSGISAPEARQLFANGEAGFIIQGIWNIGIWNESNSELNYGVMAPPLSNGERDGWINLVNMPGFGVYSQSEHPEWAARYLEEYYGGDYFQQEVVQNNLELSIVDGINEEYATGEMLEAWQINEEFAAVGPNPATNPDVLPVFSEYVDVTPNVGEILQAVAITGLRDYEQMLEELSEKTDQALENAINEAQEKGANVSIDDFRLFE
ncbi:ABC transporter substrate-binding protein [Halalkalibacter sp. AB-rgal2]|uniref:ABC transporter substrate-binding protein n=1 Tax=Halalkalibacter sp. AB-rgal2 TaxID=3242695 RepID=UPI00359D72FA